jgi:hypothetical protein
LLIVFRKNGKYQVALIKKNNEFILAGGWVIRLSNLFRATNEEVHLVLDNKIKPFSKELAAKQGYTNLRAITDIFQV